MRANMVKSLAVLCIAAAWMLASTPQALAGKLWTSGEPQEPVKAAEQGQDPVVLDGWAGQGTPQITQGELVTFISNARDKDTWSIGGCPPQSGWEYDLLKYQWDDGGSLGDFPSGDYFEGNHLEGGNTVDWRCKGAPGTVRITVTLRDKPKAVVSPDTGTRNDLNDDPAPHVQGYLDVQVLADSSPPTVTISSPTDGQQCLPADDEVHVTGTASDNIALQKIEFYVDDQLKDTKDLSSGPLSDNFDFTWDTTGYDPGPTSHELKVVAYDWAGNDASGNTDEDVHDVYIGAEDPITSVTITYPDDDPTCQSPLSGTVTVTVTHDGPNSTEIELYVKGPGDEDYAQCGSGSGSSPVEISWYTTEMEQGDGTYLLKAKATDACGEATWSDPATTVCVDNEPPIDDDPPCCGPPGVPICGPGCGPWGDALDGGFVLPVDLGGVSLARRSLDDDVGFLGSAGWGHSHHSDLHRTSSGHIVLRESSGKRKKFYLQPDGSYTSDPWVFDTLEKLDGTPNNEWYLLTRPDQVKFRYDAAGRLRRIHPPRGTGTYQYTYGYDRCYVAYVTDPFDRVTTSYTYEGSPPRIATVTVRAHTGSGTYTLGYDGAGRLASVTNPLSEVTDQFSYDANGRLAQRTNLLGQSYGYAYDGSGRLSTVSYSIGGGAVHTQTYAYGGPANGERWVTVTDERSNSTTYYMDDTESKLLRVVDALNNTTQNVYDPGVYLPKQVVNARSQPTNLTWDSAGNLLQISYPFGGSTLEWNFTYTAGNHLATAEDPLDNLTTYAWSGNYLSSVTDALSYTTSFQYDAQGRVTSITDQHENTSELRYDTEPSYPSDDLPSEVEDPRGVVTEMRYDAAGNLIQHTEYITYPSVSRTTALDYDGLNRLTTVTHPDATTRTFTYPTPLNATATVTDEEGNSTTMAYCACGRLESVTDALYNTTEYFYDDGAGGDPSLLTTLRNARDYDTAFTYDALNRLTQVTYPDSTSESYTYDANGNLLTRTNGKGTTTYTYDLLDRLTGVNYPNGTPDVDYEYDAANRLVSMTDGTGETTYDYDDVNRITSVTPPAPGRAVSYDYHDDYEDGYRQDVSLLGVGTWQYLYDPAGRLTQVTNPFGDPQETTTYTYDDLGRPTRVDLHNELYTTYAWHTARDFLLQVMNQNVRTYGYPVAYYDAVGNPGRVEFLDGSRIEYVYDDIYRLTRETRFYAGGAQQYDYQYQYDAVGNRTQVTYQFEDDTPQVSYYTCDQNNKLTQAGAVTFGYDSNGNMTSRTAGGQTTTFEYDAENQLILITYPDESTNEFVYDGAGERFSRTGSGGTVTFSYDGGSLLAEFDAGGPLAAYTHGALGAVSVELPDESGLLTVPRYYHPDALGSVHHLTDAAGQVTDNYEFDAFGNQWYASGASPNPHRFVGQLGYHLEPDAAAHGLELMKLGARYYDPSIGRFLTQDPIGYVGGVHFYSYVNNNPMVYVDPLGLQYREEFDGWSYTIDKKAHGGSRVGGSESHIDVYCTRGGGNRLHGQYDRYGNPLKPKYPQMPGKLRKFLLKRGILRSAGKLARAGQACRRVASKAGRVAGKATRAAGKAGQKLGLVGIVATGVLLVADAKDNGLGHAVTEGLRDLVFADEVESCSGRLKTHCQGRLDAFEKQVTGSMSRRHEDAADPDL